MKILYLIFVFISILFWGCSSTYRLSDFPSKDKFYEDFNNFAKDKSLQIEFINDSTIISENGARILNDSLYIFQPPEINKNVIKDYNSFEHLPLKIIKKINYKNHWLGLPFGTILGTAIGLVSGYVIWHSLTQQTLNSDRPMAGTNSQNTDAIYALLTLPPIGFTIGGIWGWIVGWDYTYEFSP